MTIDNKAELLACPFCGHPSPRIFSADWEGWTVSCRSMACAAQQHADLKEDVIARWNTRAASQARIEALEGALAAETERCAKIADPWPESPGDTEIDGVRRRIAAAIRGDEQP